jgi:hypothetical protein
MQKGTETVASNCALHRRDIIVSAVVVNLAAKAQVCAAPRVEKTGAGSCWMHYTARGWHGGEINHGKSHCY